MQGTGRTKPYGMAYSRKCSWKSRSWGRNRAWASSVCSLRFDASRQVVFLLFVCSASRSAEQPNQLPNRHDTLCSSQPKTGKREDVTRCVENESARRSKQEWKAGKFWGRAAFLPSFLPLAWREVVMVVMMERPWDHFRPRRGQPCLK